MAIDLNECMVSGTVIEDPQIVGEGDGAWAFIKLMTSYGQQNADGSYSDAEQIITVVADASRHVNTVKNYIKKGKALAVSAYFRTWQANSQEHYGFFVRKFIFAKANYGGNPSGNTPPMPK